MLARWYETDKMENMHLDTYDGPPVDDSNLIDLSDPTVANFWRRAEEDGLVVIVEEGKTFH